MRQPWTVSCIHNDHFRWLTQTSRAIFRCIFGIKVFIKIFLSPFSYNMYICMLNIFTIKRDSLQCIPIFYIQNCNFSFSIGHFLVPKTLTFKMRLGAQPFLWKWVSFAWECKALRISCHEEKEFKRDAFWRRYLSPLCSLLFPFCMTFFFAFVFFSLDSVY